MNSFNDILIIRSNKFLLSAKEWDQLRKSILSQKDSGIIVLPYFCEAMVVPKDIEIKIENKEE